MVVIRVPITPIFNMIIKPFNNIYYDKTILSKRINDENINNTQYKINSFYLNYVNSIDYL